MRLFVAVCETRNIARAAELENIVGSAISKRLAYLEEVVGTTLLVRQRHGVTPTPAGETLLEHARTMLSTSERIYRDMASYSKGIRGHITLLANISAIAESVPDDVAEFLKNPAHRGIQIDIEERNSKDVVRCVRDGSASIGIFWDAIDHEGLRTRHYSEDHLAVVTYEGHPLASLDSVSFEQTLDFDHVTLPSTTSVQAMLNRAAAIIGKPMNCRSVVSTFDAALRVVRSGLAITVMPFEMARPWAAIFGLHIIPLTSNWSKRTFSICYRDESLLSPAARLLMEHLAAKPPQDALPS